MHSKLKELSLMMESEGYVGRGEQMGEMMVVYEQASAGMDPAPMFKGLPDDRCQCHHWGYVIKGRLKIRYADRDESFEAGEVFYIAPGHIPLVEEATETIEFTRKEELDKTYEVVSRNARALQG